MVKISGTAIAFTKSRQRFIDCAATDRLLEAVIEQARQCRLLSKHHFGVVGGLIDARTTIRSHWAFRGRNHPGHPHG